MPFDKELAELEQRKNRARQMGGPEKIARKHAQGRLTAREWLDRLLDPGTFREIGILNHSDMPGMEEKTPADSKIGGFGKIDGRHVAICANDFTVLAASTSRVAMRKEGDVRLASERRGIPFIYLGEAGGARIPDIMGAKGLVSYGFGFDMFLHGTSRIRQSPMIMAVMGQCYGAPTWMACLADFVVQVKGSSLSVSGPRVLGQASAISEEVSEEELGGWRVHAEITGMADRVAADEEDCFRIIKQYLSFMPSHCDRPAPRAEVPEGAGKDMERILDFLPANRRRTYDMEQILRCIIDPGSYFPLKPHFGKMVITALARIDGRVVGIIANQPLHNAGAMDTDGIDKVISFFCLCDSFNIPLVFLHDIPGFLVGKEAERKRVAARVINYMNALALVTVPKISIIIRKSYGMAFWNMCGTGCGADFLAAWPTAEISFIDPEVAANVVFGGKLEPGDPQWEETVERMRIDASPYGPAGVHALQDVIDPRDTREHIIRNLEICQDYRSGAISGHKLANWPTKF